MYFAKFFPFEKVFRTFSNTLEESRLKDTKHLATKRTFRARLRNEPNPLQKAKPKVP